MESTRSPKGDAKPLNEKQKKACYLRACGDSWDQISKKIPCTTRTLINWRKHPHWDEYLAARHAEWIEEYESAFTRILPAAAKVHGRLLLSNDEHIQMRAVSAAHTHRIACVKEIETRSEVEELREMVATLTEQLEQQQQRDCQGS